MKLSSSCSATFKDGEQWCSKFCEHIMRGKSFQKFKKVLQRRSIKILSFILKNKKFKCKNVERMILKHLPTFPLYDSIKSKCQQQ
jgi:predicted nucleic acid-binding Zn ribbon protein